MVPPRLRWSGRRRCGINDDDAAASKAAFELYTDSVDEWRWRPVHDNGNIIADGGGGYSDKRDAKSGIGASSGTRPAPT